MSTTIDTTEAAGVQEATATPEVAAVQETPGACSFTAADIQRKGTELVRLHRNKKEEYGFIEPEYLLGFREGSYADLSPYQALGFPHPKAQDYYKIKFDDKGEPCEGDPEFLKIYESITRSNKIDDPVLIYYYGGQILVLNGLTRLSVVGQRRQVQPGFMKRVPFRLFVGEETQARGEMVRLNLDGRQRVIKQREFITMVKLFKDYNMTVGEIRKMITGSTDGNYEINNTITVAFYGCAELIKKLLDKKIALNVAAEISLVEDPLKQAEIVKNHDSKASLQKTKLLTRGIAAVVPMIDEIFRKIAKVSEAAEKLGIYGQCEDDFAGIQEHLKALKNSIAEVEREASDDMGDLGVNDDGEDDMSDLLHPTEIDDSLADEPDATEAYLAAEAAEAESKPVKTAMSKTPKPVLQESDDVYRFDIKANGDGKLDEERVSKEEVEKFVKLWWKECSSRPVDASELLEIAEKHNVFKHLKKLPTKKQTRCIFLAKCILSPLSGTKNDVNGYYWLRGFRSNKNWWKLEKI